MRQTDAGVHVTGDDSPIRRSDRRGVAKRGVCLPSLDRRVAFLSKRRAGLRAHSKRDGRQLRHRSFVELTDAGGRGLDGLD
jgi:hypothetical protein